MRLVTFRPRDGDPRLGAMVEGAVVDIATPVAPIATSMIELLRAGAAGFDLARRALAAGLASPAAGIRHDPRTVTLLAPVPNPSKILGVGRNTAHTPPKAVSPHKRNRASSSSCRAR